MMVKNASTNAIAIGQLLRTCIRRLEFDSIHIDKVFIPRLKHLARLLSLNVLKQCLKVWRQLKCDLSAYARLNSTWQAMDRSPFGLLRT